MSLYHRKCTRILLQHWACPIFQKSIAHRQISYDWSGRFPRQEMFYYQYSCHSQQSTTSSYDRTLHLPQATLFVVLEALRFSSIEYKWESKTVRVCWKFLYAVGELFRVLINTCFPGMMFFQHQRINGVVNTQMVSNLRDDPQTDCYDQPRIYDMVCFIELTCHRPSFFKKDSVTIESYWNMLTMYLFALCRLLLEDYILHQDDALRHYTDQIAIYLNNKHPNNWIGSGGPIAWLAGSPIWPLAIPFCQVLSNQRFILYS